jgi:hypothetical protein
MGHEADEERNRYIGDGVYASFDGWYVWLHTDRENGRHTIALEPAVFDNLLRFTKGVWKEEKP